MIPMRKLPICKKCPFWTHEFIPPTIVYGSDILLVGDSSWRQEAIQGRVFVGPSGEVLTACLEDAGINRSDISITNAVLCKPAELGVPHPKGVEEICREHFLKPTIKELSPKIIVPMGNIALKSIVKDRGNITKVRGTFQDVDFFDQRIKILPSFHPSYILHNPAHIDYLVNDLQIVKSFIDTGDTINRNIPEVHYHHIDTMAKFERFWNIVKDAKEIACDIETTSLDVRKADILSISFSVKERESFVITFFVEKHIKLKSGKMTIDAGSEPNTQTFNTHVIRRLWKLIHSGKRFYYHNGKFDLRHLHYWFLRNVHRGMTIEKVKWYDTQGMQGLLNENMRQSLKEISSVHTDIKYSREELDVVHGGRLAKIPLKDLVIYNAKDTDACFRVAKKYSKQMFDEGLWQGPFVGKDYSDMEVANVLFKMELFGAPINPDKLFEIRHTVERKLKEFYYTMDDFTDGVIFPKKKKFNPNSHDHIKMVLFDHLNFPDTGIHTDGGKISTNKESIEILHKMEPDHEFLQAFILYQQYASIHKTFIKGFDRRMWDDNRLRPDFSFTKTVSGRIVCYDPNLLNIPRDKEFEEGILLSIRELFYARPGRKIVYGDFSQIEFKCCAYLSGDKRLIEDIFEHHEDFHDLIAKSAYPWYADLEAKVKKFEGKRLSPDLLKKLESAKIKLKTGRTKSKNFNFGWMFGGETPTLAAALGVTEDQVQIFTGRIEKRYPKFWRYVKSVGEVAIQTGVIVNPFMRKRRIPPTPDERTQAQLGRKASNFGPQSTAAYCGRGALTRIAKKCDEMDLQAYPFNVVYDAILLEAPDEEVEDCKRIMVEEMLRPVPEVSNHIFSAEVGVGQSWKSAEQSARKYYSVNDLEEK